MEIYWIGGSPCSGKSTVAEALAEKYGMHYFKVDDHLERYMQLGAGDGKPCCLKASRLSPDQIWLRDPREQCEEELQIYAEIFGYILADLDRLKAGARVITEGAAYLPVLAQLRRIPHDRYISITPTKDFQVLHYSRREWVPQVLAGCSDRQKAFDNWMERDALFAEAVRRQCREYGYASIVNDGEASEAELLERVAAHFGLI